MTNFQKLERKYCTTLSNEEKSELLSHHIENLQINKQPEPMVGGKKDLSKREDLKDFRTIFISYQTYKNKNSIIQPRAQIKPILLLNINIKRH